MLTWAYFEGKRWQNLNQGVEYETTRRPNHMLQKILHRMNAAHKREPKMGSSGKTKRDTEAR
jgi:hypothetical protein